MSCVMPLNLWNDRNAQCEGNTSFGHYTPNEWVGNNQFGNSPIYEMNRHLIIVDIFA